MMSEAFNVAILDNRDSCFRLRYPIAQAVDTVHGEMPQDYRIRWSGLDHDQTSALRQSRDVGCDGASSRAARIRIRERDLECECGARLRHAAWVASTQRRSRVEASIGKRPTSLPASRGKKMEGRLHSTMA